MKLSTSCHRKAGTYGASPGSNSASYSSASVCRAATCCRGARDNQAQASYFDERTVSDIERHHRQPVPVPGQRSPQVFAGCVRVATTASPRSRAWRPNWRPKLRDAPVREPRGHALTP